jgi:plastocyanin
MQFTVAALTALMGLVSAETVHVVSVSNSSGAIAFSPDSITVPTGDMIQFQFLAGNHSVVQSNFDNACQPISLHSTTTGIFSGFMPVAASAAEDMIPTFTIQVTNSSTPMWLYCAQAKHCQSGMSMVVNQK